MGEKSCPLVHKRNLHHTKHLSHNKVHLYTTDPGVLTYSDIFFSETGEPVPETFSLLPI